MEIKKKFSWTGGLLILAVLLFLNGDLVPVAADTGDEDNESNYRLVKWDQPPDLSNNGVDVRCDRNDGVERWLADDFECDTPGDITKITFWGSWEGIEKGYISSITIGFHEDIPAWASPTGYSMPEEVPIAGGQFFHGEFLEIYEGPVSGGEWFWDPYTPGSATFPGDYEVWRYEIDTSSSNIFHQEGLPDEIKVYWLSIWVETTKPHRYQFGWKTSTSHWNDNAVWYDKSYTDRWYELEYFSGHVHHGDAIDLAFQLSFVPDSFYGDDSEIDKGGGSENLNVNPHPAYANRDYVVLGGLSGTSPGTPVPGILVLPLNWDPFTDFVVANLNTWIFSNFLGTLDNYGNAVATLNYPPLPPSMVGIKMYFAYTLYNPFDFVSNPIDFLVVQ